MQTEAKQLTMVDSFIPAAAALGGIVTYWVIGFVEDAGMGLAISAFEKVGGSMTVGLVLFFLLRWALKRNDSLTEEIRTMQKERASSAEQHFQEIKEILKSKT